MKRFFRMLSCALLAGAWVGVCSAGSTASVVLAGRQLGEDSNGKYWTYSNITLAHADDKPFKSLMISLTRELVDSDEIALPDDASKIRDKEDLCTKTSKIIQIDGGATDEEIADYLSGVKFYTVNNPRGQGVKVVATPEDISARTFYFEGTRHYYQFVDTSSNFTPWHTAYDLAKNLRFLGRRGYLATVMSKDEDLFIYKVSNKVGWLGGTLFKHGNKQSIDGNDLYFENFQKSPYWKEYSGGNDEFDTDRYGRSEYPNVINSDGWYWACGPERGTVFFSPYVVRNGREENFQTWVSPDWKAAFINEKGKGRYFNWECGHGGFTGIEPNQQHEPCLTTLDSSGFVGYATKGTSAESYSWNNIRDSEPHAGSQYKPLGYFVEYGNQLVGDTTETNPPQDWGVVEVRAPSIYNVKLEGVANPYYLADDVASNVWAAASIAGLAPPDAVRTNFFGWSKTQGATIPDLIDQQPIQGYAPALETINLYAVWTDQPVVSGRLMTRKGAETFQLKAIDCNRQPAGTLVITDGGGTDTNLVCYAFAAPRGLYGLDVTRKNSTDGAWIKLVTIETDGVTTGPDFTQERIWDTTGTGSKDFTNGLDKDWLIRRFSQSRGGNGNRPILFDTMPIFDTSDKTDWAIRKFADHRNAGRGDNVPRRLYNRPEVMADVLGADGSISVRMKEHWHELAEARSPDFMQLSLTMIAAYSYFGNGKWYYWTWTNTGNGVRDTVRATDIGPALKTGEFVVAAVQDADCQASTTNLPWRIYRYYKGEDGVEHYDVIKQRHEGSVYSDGQDLGEYIELHDGYSLLYLKRFGQFAFIDPTDVEIDPGDQYKQNESTWGWTNMTAYGEMKYDRMELTLHNSTNADDKILFPGGASWEPLSQPNQHQVYTNTTESTNVSVCDIVTNVLNKVRLELPSNGDDIYWTIKLYRADGYKPYEFDIGISNAWYVVAYRPTIPEAGDAVYLTYKNVRTIRPPLASENLGFGYSNKVFYCWQRGGQKFLDDGQAFFDISKAFQTNYLDACWVDTPVISGDCPTNVNAQTGAKLVSLGATNVISGDILYAWAAPGRYLATAVPGIYDIVYTDKDGLPHTELIELTEGRRTGPSFADDVISTGVENADAEPGFKLLAGGMRAYEAAVYDACSRFFNETRGHDYDHFSTPRFDLVSAKVTDAEREAFQGAETCFAVRSRISMTFLSTPDPSYRYDWVPAVQSNPSKLGTTGYLVGTNILIDLVVPFDTRPFASCTNTWAIYRRGDDGVVDTLTTVPNAKGEFFTTADDYILLTVEKFGAFGIKTPDLNTLIDLGAAGYTNDFGVSYFPAAQGSGDRLYSSVRIDLKNFDSSLTMIGMVEMGLLDPENYGAEMLTNSTRSSMCVRFDTPKTAAEIATFIAHCLWVDADYSFVGADVTVSCFENDSAEGEAQYTSEPGHIKTRAAAFVFRPGTRGTVNGDDVDFIAPSNTVQYLIPAELFFELGFWKTNMTETTNTYFYGWEYDGEVRYGAEQRVLNKFRIGETNILTAVWTNMPVIAGDIASDSNAVTVAIRSFTNLVEATVFEGGSDINRYAQPMPADRPYNVAVEYRDTVGGEVKSVETVLVTNDVVSGAFYDSTGRVTTATSVLASSGDLDFVLVGGLDSITGDCAAVVAKAGHLTSGESYAALTNAVGTKDGTYFDFGLEIDGSESTTSSVPLTVLLPFDSSDILDPTNLFKVYRYQDGEVVELATNEYAVGEGYLELVTTNFTPIAVAKSSPIVFADCGADTLRWKRTTARSSYFAAVRLKLVSGDADSLRDACFLFEDRISNRVDGVAVTNACLWGGRLDRQGASNHIASDTVRVNGTVFRKVPLEFFREAVCNVDEQKLVTYGVTDESYANTNLVLLPAITSFPVDPAVTNAWAHQSEIEVMSRPGEKLGDTPETLNGVMGFLGYSTGGERMTYLALASGEQGGVTNYHAVVEEITAAALNSSAPRRMLQLVSEGPVSLAPANLSRIRTSLAVTAIVDENSDPYCRITDIVFGETEITGHIEVGAGDVKGAVGRNASVTLRGSATVDGPYVDLQTIQSVGVDGAFRFEMPSAYSFFKLRINIREF